MIQQSLPRLAAALGMCALCLGATSNSCTFFGIGRGDSDITVDLATEEPADPQLAQVIVPLVGLEFVRQDNDVETLTFRDPEFVDLTDYRSGFTPLRIFTEEELREGTYTGVRLLFDEEDEDAAFVVDTAGSEFQLTFAQGEYAPLDFVAEEDGRDESWTLTLDLRQSLSVDDDEYVLRPVLRSVVTDEAGDIEGTVTATCPSGTSLSEGGAVYLFEGSSIEPDDIDDSGIEPYATAPVRAEGLAAPFRYTLRFLPEGRYTIALTCSGHEDDPTESDNLRFQNVRNVDVEEDETLIHDIG